MGGSSSKASAPAPAPVAPAPDKVKYGWEEKNCVWPMRMHMHTQTHTHAYARSRWMWLRLCRRAQYRRTRWLMPTPLACALTSLSLSCARARADGGAYKAKSNLQQHLSTMPDEMMLWRYEARSLRLLEMFEEANEAMAKRPEAHESRVPKNLDLNKAIDQACHRTCSELWTAYDRCLTKKKGDLGKCSGWYGTYINCVDTCTPKMVLNVLETMASDDPDPNMERLRR